MARKLALGAGTFAAIIAFGPAAHAGSDLAPGVLAEINFIRTHPRDYAQDLRRGEMTPATAEAIAYLENRPPAPPLRPEPGLGASAAGHAADQARHDSFEHTGSDGSTPGERMRGEGVWAGLLAEEMSAGDMSAAGLVRQMIIDEDVPDRGHRNDLLDPELKRAGVGCATHPTYGTVCVVDLASAAPKDQ